MAIKGAKTRKEEHKKFITELKKKYPKEGGGTSKEIAMLAGQLIRDKDPTGILKISPGFDHALTQDIINNSNFSILGDLPTFFEDSIELMKDKQLFRKMPNKHLKDKIDKKMKPYIEKYIDPTPPQELIDMLAPSFNDFVKEYMIKNLTVENITEKERERVRKKAERAFMKKVAFLVFRGMMSSLPKDQLNRYASEIMKLDEFEFPALKFSDILGRLLVKSDWLKKLKTAELPKQDQYDQVVKTVKGAKLTELVKNRNYDVLIREIPKINFLDYEDWKSFLDSVRTPEFTKAQKNELIKLVNLARKCNYFSSDIDLTKVPIKMLMGEIDGKSFMQIAGYSNLNEGELQKLREAVNKKMAKGYSELPKENQEALRSIRMKFIEKRNENLDGLEAFIQNFNSLDPVSLTKEDIINFSKFHYNDLSIILKREEDVTRVIRKIEKQLEKLQRLKKPENVKKQLLQIYENYSKIAVKVSKSYGANQAFKTDILGNCCPIHAFLYSPKSKSKISLDLLEIICQNKEPIDFVNQKNPEGKTPLKLAIELKNAEAVKILIENGANLNEVQFNNDIFALGDESVIQLLIDWNKYPQLDRNSFDKMRDKGSHSELRKLIMDDKKPKGKMKDIINESFCLKGSKSKPMTPLQFAASKGDLPYIRKLITTHKAKVNEGTPSPLKMAFDKGDINCVRALIMAGAKLPSNISTRMGDSKDTILHFAARTGDEFLIRKLLTADIKSLKRLLTTENQDKETPLDLILATNKPISVKLIKAIPDDIVLRVIDRKNPNTGKTPIQTALENKDLDSAYILRKKGATLPAKEKLLSSKNLASRTSLPLFDETRKKPLIMSNISAESLSFAESSKLMFTKMINDLYREQDKMYRNLVKPITLEMVKEIEHRKDAINAEVMALKKVNEFLNINKPDSADVDGFKSCVKDALETLRTSYERIKNEGGKNATISTESKSESKTQEILSALSQEEPKKQIYEKHKF